MTCEHITAKWRYTKLKGNIPLNIIFDSVFHAPELRDHVVYNGLSYSERLWNCNYALPTCGVVVFKRFSSLFPIHILLI